MSSSASPEATPTTTPAPTPDNRSALLHALPQALQEAAQLSRELAQALTPLVSAAAPGPERETAQRGLQLQDTLQQRLERLADAAAGVLREPQGDVRALLCLDALTERLSDHDAGAARRTAAAEPDIELF